MMEGAREKKLLPCYFFHGEETYLAYQFIEQLKESLVSPDVEEHHVEKFSLEETSWSDIIDLARTVPLFFTPRRVIQVEVPEEGSTTLSSRDERLLKDYLSSPSSRSIIVVLCPGKIKKSHVLLKFFSSFPSHTVSVREVKPLNENRLYAWMERKLLSCGKRATLEAQQRLEEINGSNLALLDNELEKLVAFVGDRKLIELDDVNQSSGWAKTFAEYELTNSLEEGDFRKSLLALNSMFREGTKPEYIFGIISKFFRDILLAKLWLKEKSRDRKAIFREVKPQIQEKFGQLYRKRFDEFFSLVESVPDKEFNNFLKELERVDFSAKTSSASQQPLLERFLFHFCTYRKEKRLLGRQDVE